MSFIPLANNTLTNNTFGNNTLVNSFFDCMKNNSAATNATSAKVLPDSVTFLFNTTLLNGNQTEHFPNFQNCCASLANQGYKLAVFDNSNTTSCTLSESGFSAPSNWYAAGLTVLAIISAYAIFKYRSVDSETKSL